MENINSHICCGCGGCVEVCPTHCIEMKKTSDGFYRAFADETACIGCGLCVEKCAMRHRSGGGKPMVAYAAYNCNEKLRQKSSSGGVFSALAKVILDRGGAVFGAAFDENMHLAHVCAEDQTSLESMRGSKYLQSDIRGIYSKVEMLLETGREVLFVGVPCQVAGLKTALGKEYENLLTCDLVCHGVPSPGLFRGYVDFLEKKYKNKITDYTFRSKEHANDRMSYTVKLTFQDGRKIYLSGDEEPYTMRFISGALQRESCYACPFSCNERVGDITMADYWGYEIVHPELEGVKGISLVLVNSEKGKCLLDQARGLRLMFTEEDKYLTRNSHLSAPAKKHPQRDSIYNEFEKQGFSKVFYEKTFLPDGYKLYILKRRLKGARGVRMG